MYPNSAVSATVLSSSRTAGLKPLAERRTVTVTATSKTTTLGLAQC